MKLKMPYFVIAGVAGIMIMNGQVLAQSSADGTAWGAPDRAAKVAGLIPGRKIPNLTRETLFADWTKQQAAKWNKAHPSTLTPEEQYKQYAETAPTDAELLADFPRHIAPLAQVRTGTPKVADWRNSALISYCPLCQSRSFSLKFDPKNEYHATTVCCNAELYGREKDFPADYKLKSTEKVAFRHFDNTLVEVPCTLFTDKDGVVWELFIKTLFDQKRWLNIGGDLIRKYGEEFKKSGDPLYAHKIAILLDAVTDTYYGLPLAYLNVLAKGKDGKPLTRTEWENSVSPDPAFQVGPLGVWNRRVPNFNTGWLNMGGEHIWVEPFALTRHHPAFQAVSVKKFGSPGALDTKITGKLLGDLCLMFKSVFAQKLMTNYQDAIYMNMILLGVLAQDKTLTDFAVPGHEVTLYNHTYHDGLNGEGSPDYMAMPCGYFLPYLADPNGWLRFQPNFVKDNPFYTTAISQLKELETARGFSIEFGDKHVHAFHPYTKNGTLKGISKADNERNGSRNWAAFGVGILRVGSPNHRMELSMNYTRATLHNSQDALSIECWVDGVPVMRRGGYSAWWTNARLQWERPEFKVLAAMDYPHKIYECSSDGGFASWSWTYAHSPLCQNAVMVDGQGAGSGWGSNRGYGEVITYKGGEAPGTPGADFQILDVKDHYAWQQVGKTVPEFRRTLIAAESSTGRPYALDLLKIKGGKEHALFNSAWAERAESVLPASVSKAKNLEDVLPGGGAGRGTDRSYFKQVRGVERLGSPGTMWDLTWKTDFAAYAPRPVDGKPFVRPMPEDEGKVRLRMLGFDRGSAPAELISAKGPWLASLTQQLPGNRKVGGVVAFEDGRDFLIERRGAVTGGQEQESLFIHILEGFREGENSIIKSAKLLTTGSVQGSARDIVAICLSLTDGTADTVLYQSEPGIARLPDGTETDARYALIRRSADGKVRQIETCRASFVKGAGIDYKFPGDSTGEIVDIIGDLTGTRQESALILKAKTPWPEGDLLKGRQLLVTFESDLRASCNEGYRIEKVTNLPHNRVRVDLQNHAPFIVSWHDVYDLPADKPGALRTNRPLVSNANTPWYNGMTVWFPEKNRTYTIRKTSPVGPGYLGETVEMEGDPGTPELAKDGIAPGDWFVISGIRPGLKVNVASEWRLNGAITNKISNTKINLK
jgi:hypothetical protein